MPLIGLDLDNTLIDYSGVFGSVGVELGLLPKEGETMTKAEVRDCLRARPEGESQWMRLQGQVYGRFLNRAEPYPGVFPFLKRLGGLGATFCVVSHKTRTGHFDLDRVDLWRAARKWLVKKGFFNLGSGVLAPDAVYFEETREKKLARIGALGCDAFIDDLPEVLLHEDFPVTAQRFWFGAGQDQNTAPRLTYYHSWTELTTALESCLFKVKNQE